MSGFPTALDVAWDKLRKKLGRDPTQEEGEVLEGELFQQWIDDKRFDELIGHLHEEYELEGGHVDCITLGKALRAAGETGRVHTLFRGLVASRSRAFWRSWPQAEKGHLGHMRDAARHYASCMEALAEYHHSLWSLKLETEMQAVKEEMLRFQARQKPAAPARRARGLSEKQFWAMLEAARASSGSASQFAGALEAALAAATPADIEAFDSLLRNKLAQLNSWDLWAFAHIARGGCSDDSFDYFRAWIVAGGKAMFDAALRGPDALLEHHEDCWDLQCEELLGVASEAYRAATGAEFKAAPGKPAPPSGERWTEADLPVRYPRVEAFFAKR